MGTYDFWTYYETFGGFPDRDEYAPDLDELADRARDEEREGGRERHGFGVCVRGTCDSPCGENGGCVR